MDGGRDSSVCLYLDGFMILLIPRTLHDTAWTLSRLWLDRACLLSHLSRRKHEGSHVILKFRRVHTSRQRFSIAPGLPTVTVAFASQQLLSFAV